MKSIPSKERIYYLVKGIIDECDFMGLLAINCPEDEYDPECRRIVDDIVKILKKRKRKGMKIHLSLKRLNELIFDTFINYFAKDEEDGTIEEKTYSDLYSQASLFRRASAEIWYDLN